MIFVMYIVHNINKYYLKQSNGNHWKWFTCYENKCRVVILKWRHKINNFLTNVLFGQR